MKIQCKLALLMAVAVLCPKTVPAQQLVENPLTVVATWSQYGFLPNHSSFNNFEQTLSRTNVSNLTWKWAGQVGTSPASAPVVGQGTVYVASDGVIFAFQASDGTPLWSRLSCGGVNTVEAALGPQVLLVGDGGGDLAAYDPVTGNQVWCFNESGSITSAPAVHANTVYITNGASAVAADQLTGTQRWRFTPSDLSPLTNTPAVLNTAVYVTGGSSVFGLDRNSGQQLWRTDLEPQDNISAPSVAGNTVYVGGKLYALRASDGTLRWTQNIVGANVSMPAIAYRKVIVNSQDAAFGLWAFRTDTGAFLWQNGTTEESLGTVTVANGVVFEIAESGQLMTFNSDTGAFLGTVADPDGHPFNHDFRSQVAVVNGTVYVPTSDALGSNRVDALGLP